MNKPYPKHIYDPVRREVAVDYIRRELRKYLPSVPEGDWSIIDKDVKCWFDQSANLMPVRDFWNGFWGMAMGFKLKIGLTSFLTGENINWKKEKVPVDDLCFGGKWPSENPVGKGKYTSVVEVKDYYKDKTVLQHQKHILGNWKEGRSWDNFSIIVTEKEMDGKTVMVVYDGNGRLDKAVIENEKYLNIWLGRFADERRKPVNYWVTTPVIMELVWLAKDAWKEKNTEAFKALVMATKRVISDSESGRYELENRSMSGTEEFRKEFSLLFNSKLL